MPITELFTGARPITSEALALAWQVFVRSLIGPDQAYVGPGAGLAISVSFLTVLLIIAGVLLVVLFGPVSWLWSAVGGRGRRRDRRFGGVVVLGLDGLDPAIAEELMDYGRLPHLAALARDGHYTRLATTLPAITPPAWSSFMTGNDPSYHGVYDFITRDTATYLPRVSSCEVVDGRKKRVLNRFLVPLSRPRVRRLRKGVPFWHTLARQGLEATILRVPVTFPPESFRGRLLSGLAVPDLLGTQGTSGHFTTADRESTAEGVRSYRLVFQDGVARSEILGPRHPFLAADGNLTALLEVRRNGTPDSLSLSVGHRRFDLAEGQTSDWVLLAFRAGPVTIHGAVQFHLGSSQPEVELHMTPVHLDPERPAMPISQPGLFSNYLAKRIGPYGTLGLMEDTTALNEGVLDEAGFLDHAWKLFEERRAMLFTVLDAKFDDVTVCVFDTPDRIQHMFWHYREDEHPALRGHSSRAHSGAIDEMYEEMDRLVGQIMERLDDDALLLVISDHGFTSFQRGVNLNAWLREHGYLHLHPGAQIGRDWLEGVDWSRTRAYALGLAGVFINLKGRESEGIVEPGAEFADLAVELKAGLEGLADEQRGGRRAIRRAYIAGAHFDGPFSFDGPDLIVGYEAQYRCSWECATGQVTESVIADNTRSWSSDHCVDPELVPGVLFANAVLRPDNARLIDVAPTILDVFGVEPEVPMQGVSLLPARDDPDTGPE